MIEIILAVGLQTKHYVLLHNFNLTQFGLNYSRVPNKRTSRLLENEKKSHLYALIQTYPFINFHQKIPPIRLFPPKVSISPCQRNLMKTYHNEANTSGITKIASKNFLEFFEQSS